MNVSLSAELEQFVQDRVKSGMYQSASEVVRDGLRLLRDQDEQLEDRRAQIDAKVKRGLEQLARDEGVGGEEAAVRFQRSSEDRRRQRA